LSCGFQATAYYGELLNFIETGEYTEFSARAGYSQTRLSGGGSFVRDNAKLAVNYGFNKESNVLSHYNENRQPLPNEELFIGTDWITEQLKKEADVFASKKYALIEGKSDIDRVANAILENNGALIGYIGANGRFDNKGVLQRPLITDKLWGHLVFACGFKKINREKWIKIINSWGKNWGDNGFGYIPESYFREEQLQSYYSLVFNPWVLTDKTNNLIIPEYMKKDEITVDELIKKYDTQLIRNAKTGAIGWVYNNKLMVANTTDRFALMLASYLHRKENLASISPELWDKFEIINF
jgi:hypothetical protein